MASTYERTRPGRPWRNTAPLCAPPEVRQPYGPGDGHPQALTPPSEGPAAGGLEKGGRESSRSSQTPEFYTSCYATTSYYY